MPSAAKLGTQRIGRCAAVLRLFTIVIVMLTLALGYAAGSPARSCHASEGLSKISVSDDGAHFEAAAQSVIAGDWLKQVPPMHGHCQSEVVTPPVDGLPTVRARRDYETVAVNSLTDRTLPPELLPPRF